MDDSPARLEAPSRAEAPTSGPPDHRGRSPAVDERMSTWLLLGGLIVMVIIVGMSLEILENRRIDREAH
jgi:hypothetical protein